MRLRLLCFSAAALLLAGCSSAPADDASQETPASAPAEEESAYPRTLDIPGGQGEPEATVTLEAEPTRIALPAGNIQRDRKSTRLNSSHVAISYVVFCLKIKKSK